ncbi:hypothetical protein NL676_002146 [Syzygium grande]|nr:hypothetical protein NL676_002146 [Syzygium grande]
MAGVSLKCGDCNALLKFVEEAQGHIELTSHSNFSKSTEAVLNLVCSSCEKPCRPKMGLHVKSGEINKEESGAPLSPIEVLGRLVFSAEPSFAFSFSFEVFLKFFPLFCILGLASYPFWFFHFILSLSLGFEDLWGVSCCDIGEWRMIVKMQKLESQCFEEMSVFKRSVR